MKALAKKILKPVAQNVLGRIPPPKSRLTGKLAIHGGTPVRHPKFRPWPEFPRASQSEWTLGAGPVLKRLFRTGAEGLPQPLAKQFGEKWARYCQTSHALLVPHGTDALRIGVAAALDTDGLQYGGEIIVPNLTFIASATAALDRRVGIALVDVDPSTLNIDPKRVEQAIVPGKTKAIMAVHLFGHPADMAALQAIAKKHSLMIIEDAAHAPGAIHELGRAGSLGNVAGFSFQGYKNLPSGEGGALTTNDGAIFERAYGLHNVGRKLVGGLRWGHETLGLNCRPTEYVAAVLLHRFQNLERQQQTRWQRFQLLRKLFEGLSCVQMLGLGPGLVRHGVHMFVMRYNPQDCGGLEVLNFIRALVAEGVPLGRAYQQTLAQQKVIQNLAAAGSEYVKIHETPVADECVKNLIFLPHQMFLGSEAEMVEVAAAFRKVEAYYTKRSSISLAKLEVAALSVDSSTSTATQGTIVPDPVAKRLRVGIVGAGFMGLQHAEALRKQKHFTLAGFSDVQAEAAAKAAKKYDCATYEDAEKLIASGKLDVIVIATPHWQHAEVASMALKSGLHVICEKPLTVTVEQADELISLAESSDKLFAAVHQTRLEPSYQFAKKLLDSGEMGPIYRCSMVESAWRTNAYYRSSPWRGTWKGEGGGVLLNQAPHVLDRYAWFCGMPVGVLGRCDTNLHPIEVEDTVSAIFRHANGMHGMLHVNTVECPPISQTTICCDRGRIVLDRGRVFVSKLRQSINTATKTDPRNWGDLAFETQEQEFPFGHVVDALLVAFYEDFAKAAEGRHPLVCSGTEARNAVELANAIVLSSAQHKELSLPLDRAAYTKFIDSKIGANLVVEPQLEA